MRLVDEVHGGAEKLLVHRLHALPGQRAGILAALLAPGAESRIFAGGVGERRRAAEHAARTKALAELDVLRIVWMFRLVFGVEVVEIAEEYVEAVHGR